MADPELAQPVDAIRGEGFVVHQLLHGYNDGHRLLAGSLPLSRESSRRIGYLSDLSGPTLPRGFEGYVTGYPVPDHAGYALAMTWSAPEMPRPGCVWTHTLLLEENLVTQLRSLDELLPLFARPSTVISTDTTDRLSTSRRRAAWKNLPLSMSFPPGWCAWRCGRRMDRFLCR